MTISKYDNLGEKIYIADKDSKIITSIETNNYTRVGTFLGHSGVIWSLDLSSDDSILISASGDLTIGFYCTLSGELFYRSQEKCIPKYVCTQKKIGTNYVAIICEAITRKSSSYIVIYDLDNIKSNDFQEKKKLIWTQTSKPNVLEWLSEDELIIGCDDGKIIILNIEEQVDLDSKEFEIHSDSIKSFVWNKNKSQILTSSIDCTSKQIDITDKTNLKIINTYKSTVPVNWACWNHSDRKVFLGGGIEAMNVAKTSNNDLNLKIYRTSDQKLTNHIASHFGPIRYIDYSPNPNKKTFITASQDGSVKIYFLPENEQNLTDNEQNLTDNINIQRFNDGLENPECLTDETNKIINLTWKPPKNKPSEKPVTKWIPGMAKSNSNSNKEEVYDVSKIDNDDIDDKIRDMVGKEENISTVRVTNLPTDIRAKTLFDMFDLYGRIEERNGIKIKEYEDHTYGKQTIAFIRYVYPESAQKAIDYMNGTPFEFHVIRVELAKPKK